MPIRVSTGGQIGRSLPRLEGREKVTGRAEYTHTMRLPGMLHGKISQHRGAWQDQIHRHQCGGRIMAHCAFDSRATVWTGS